MSKLPARREPNQVEVLPPVSIETLAGYRPERLDFIIQPLMDAAGTSISAIQKILPLLETAADAFDDARIRKQMQTPEGINQAERLAAYAERTSKVMRNLVEVVDSLSRLRSMLSGGPDRRIEFGTMSDKELAALVFQFVGSCPKCGHKFTE